MGFSRRRPFSARCRRAVSRLSPSRTASLSVSSTSPATDRTGTAAIWRTLSSWSATKNRACTRFRTTCCRRAADSLFQLGDLFPKLSRSVVGALDRSDLDALYAVQAQEPPARFLGEAQTEAFVLRHLFRFAPETIRQASDLLRFLLRRHYRRLRLPPTLEQRRHSGASQGPRVRPVAVGADRSGSRGILRVSAGALANLS